MGEGGDEAERRHSGQPLTLTLSRQGRGNLANQFESVEYNQAGPAVIGRCVAQENSGKLLT